AEIVGHGTIFYMVRYKDGSEEHNLISHRRGPPLPLPPRTVEQNMLRCHSPLDFAERIEFGALRRGALVGVMQPTRTGTARIGPAQLVVFPGDGSGSTWPRSLCDRSRLKYAMYSGHLTRQPRGRRHAGRVAGPRGKLP
ncbi:MAG TPA: hypothetical protein VIL85_05570, partial [Thermomicrobiales bacterium]